MVIIDRVLTAFSVDWH